MKSTLFKGILIAAFSAMCSLANAAAIYNVNLTVGSGSAVGTITTDGTNGVLGSGNILDWNIVLDGNPGNVFTLFGPSSGNNSNLAVSGANFFGSATELTFNFSAGSGYALFQNPSTGSGINYLCFAAQLCGAYSNAINLGTNVFGVNTSAQQGIQVVATATQVPEPATLALLGLGLMGLGFAKRRKV